jgi:hypothetical protein
MRLFVRDPEKREEAQKAFHKFCKKIDAKFIESRKAISTPNNIFKNGVNKKSVSKSEFETP